MQDSFTYQTFRVSDDRQTVYFDYALSRGDDSFSFTESLQFPVALPDTTAVARALRALHLALGISYYKLFVPPTIIHPYAMDGDEASFWNMVWVGGLGEFLYINKISPARLAAFNAQDGQTLTGAGSFEGHGVLLGIGGGKDSIVAGEVLKAGGMDVEGFVMATGEQRGQAQAVSDIMAVPLHAVKRTLDRTLLTVQAQPGAYTGHVPISLIFGLVGVTLALAGQKRYVVVANEASASLPRITWQHGSVNHQWSKSLDFERAFQAFITANIAPLTYFSAVRSLTSVAIAKAFSKFPQYFPVFTSDNSVFRIDASKRPATLWSLESPKSLSSFILLAPWLDEAVLKQTFGRDFLNEESLETLFWELTGKEGEPPLDCVGTVDELVLSLNLAYRQGKFHGDRLMQRAVVEGIVHDHNWSDVLTSMLTPQADHAVPLELQDTIMQQITDLLA